MALFTLALAGAADPAIARVFGYLLDVTEAADPTPALAATLFELAGQPPPGPDSALLRWLLAEPVVTGHDAFACSTGWRADALLLRALWAQPRRGRPHGVPSRGGRLVRRHDRARRRAAARPRPASRRHSRRSSASCSSSASAAKPGCPSRSSSSGAAGSGRTTLAAQAAARLGARLVAVDAAALAASADAAGRRDPRGPPRAPGRLDPRVGARRRPAGRAVASHPGGAADVLLGARLPLAGPPRLGHRSIRRSVRCGPIGRRERSGCGRRSRPPRRPPRSPSGRCGPPRSASPRASPRPATDEVGEVCRRLLMAGTPELLSPLPLPFTWADLVLSPATTAHLRELEAQAADRGQVLDDWGFSRLTSLGRGTTALFAGPSGTGKTMAAQVLARSLGLDLYRVDLAGVVSKYIGETEKHLRELFEACERAPVLLLFDEADALFGKRTQVSDAHDRYANIEIDYLLQRMEQFDGVAVLATNRKGDLDTAFVRRLRFIIDFAPPDADERERLWRLALEGASDVDGQARWSASSTGRAWP